MNSNYSTRRNILAALGTGAVGLAGCLGGEEYSDRSENGSEGSKQSGQGNDTTGINEETDKGNGSDPESKSDPEQENQEPQLESNFEWDDILRAEKERKAETDLENIAERVLQGENVGENFSIDINNTDYAYSHGRDHFNLDNFREFEMKDQSEFLMAISDAISVGSHYAQSKYGDGASQQRSKIAKTAEQIIEGTLDEEGAHPDQNLQMWGWGNDNHGFNYVLSEEHGLFAADTATNVIGRAGTDPMEEAPYGWDIVSRFDESWLTESNSIKANKAQNFATNGVYSVSPDVGDQQNVGVHLDILPEVFEKFKEEDSGEFLWNNYRPAIATSVYRFKEELDNEEDLVVIEPDSIDDLPDKREYNNFDQYRKELQNYVEVIDIEDYKGETHL